MLQRRMISLVGSIVCLLACHQPGNAVDFKPADNNVQLADQPIPTVGQAISTLNISNDSYISDDSYVADPRLLLGKVAEIDQLNGSCNIAAGQAQPVWAGKISGLKATGPSKPVLRQSIVTNKKLSAAVNLLSYLSASLDDSSVYSLIVTDQDVERVDDGDPSYNTSRSSWISTNTGLTSSPQICWLLAVDGFTFKNIAKKKYTRANAKAGGGAYGLKAEGAYFASNEDYSLDYRFGLSFTVLQRPATTDRSITGSSPRLRATEKQLLAPIRAIRDKR